MTNRKNAWDATAYDTSSSFVYEYGEELIELLEPSEGERILDLGCGTGHLTDRIAETGAEVVGLDKSEAMVAAAREQYPELPFVQKDATALRFDDPFDAVFSNAMLHWVTDQNELLSCVSDVLRSDGRFVAEMGGTGNVDAILSAVSEELVARGHEPRHEWYFPSIGEYALQLEAHGFEVQYATLFDRPTELEGGKGGLSTWFDLFGDALFASLSEDERREVIAAVSDQLRPERVRNGAWVVDYRRLRFVAAKTSSCVSEYPPK